MKIMTIEALMSKLEMSGKYINPQYLVYDYIGKKEEKNLLCL